MRPLFLVTLLLLTGACAQPEAPVEDEPAELERDPAAPFAFVELFTSEGCNSCPSADDLLGEMVREYKRDRVFMIAWHVDYWDFLGWEDPYGSVHATNLQYDYGDAMGLSSIYTPQMVVKGGEDEFNGSSSSEAHAAVQNGLEDKVNVGVTLWVLSAPDGNTLSVDYEVLDAPSGTDLHIALLEDKLTTAVEAGENNGFELRHDNVARAWTTVEPGAGQVELKVPPKVDLHNATLMAWVQKKNLRVVGATEIRALPE